MCGDTATASCLPIPMASHFEIRAIDGVDGECGRAWRRADLRIVVRRARVVVQRAVARHAMARRAPRASMPALVRSGAVERLPEVRASKKVVGARGFEPPTPWSRTRCATRLRYAPSTAARAARERRADHEGSLDDCQGHPTWRGRESDRELRRSVRDATRLGSRSSSRFCQADAIRRGVAVQQLSPKRALRIGTGGDLGAQVARHRVLACLDRAG